MKRFETIHANRIERYLERGIVSRRRKQSWILRNISHKCRCYIDFQVEIVYMQLDGCLSR